MRVCEVAAFGGPEVLRLAERPWPVPGPGEVVVEITAASLNPTDIAARTGHHRRRMPDLQPPFIAGWDLAGVVSDAGDGTSGFAAGSPVLGMIPWVRIGGRIGAHAQAAAVDPSWLAPRLDGLDPIAAATIPLNALTARQALDLIDLPAGATLLITGTSGAVGGFATQLAVADGLRVLAVASDGDEQWVKSLGAAEVLPRSLEPASLHPVDGLLDAVPVGAAAAAAVRDGGVALFTRGVAGIPADRGLRVEAPLVHSDPVALAQLTAQVADGRLRTRVARTFDLAQAAAAHRLMERGGLRGKLVLTMAAVAGRCATAAENR
jgi:NADPH:quinone reductase-like Zn-dependent oxidoreductase